MTDEEHKRQPPPETEVVNPRYESSTPEDVGRALLCRVAENRQEDDSQEELKSKDRFQTGI